MATQPIDLSQISQEELLKKRVNVLPLSISGTWLEPCVQELYRELDEKKILYKPECYLADEWLAPDKEPVVGIPFYLAHPTLMKLEMKMMMEVEGGTKEWCMQLLRHETGHALNYAYQIYRRRKWQKIFGRFSEEYKDTYKYRPYSKSYVRHLEDYYAQYHPDEDFAETFAVWLTPGLDWQNQYKGWKALKKLQYVNEVMKKLQGKEPIVGKGKKYWQASRLKITLNNYYKKRKHLCAEDFPDFHDANLKELFAENDGKTAHALYAHELIKKLRREIRNDVADWTGEKKYVIDELLKTLIERSRYLKLKIVDDEARAAVRISTYITTSIMNYIYTGGFRSKR